MSCATLEAIAKALGVVVRLGDDSIEERQSAEEFRWRHARRKAKKLVGMVQGTMALESQAVGKDHLKHLLRVTTNDLISSNRKLWGE